MRIMSVVLAVSMVVVLSAAAQASTLYGVNKSGTPGLTYTLNQTTGASTLVGPTGYDFPGDLTSDTRVGSYRIWAPDITTNTLIKIDPVTGAASSVAAFNSNDKIVSLAFDITTGKLYGTSAQGFGAAGDELYEIDPDTGATTLIGSLGVNNVYALAFNNVGKLYGVGQDRQALFQISTTTGAASLVAPVALTAVFDIATRPEDNVTFAVDSGTSALYTLDLGTGATTLVGNYAASNVVGLAFSPVPEPATLALLAMGGLLALRRSRRG